MVCRTPKPLERRIKPAGDPLHSYEEFFIDPEDPQQQQEEPVAYDGRGREHHGEPDYSGEPDGREHGERDRRHHRHDHGGCRAR